MKRLDEITVTIKDSKGKTFSKDWKNTDDKRNAIRWTLESGDVPYYVDIAEIVEIKVTKHDTFSEDIMLEIGDKVKIIDVHEFSAYEIGDVMTVKELLKSKIIAVDKYGEEHALWINCILLLNK